ncbi:helix-turn-helix domain-containing protein [Nocardia huaxiensis]|uniref:Helix-turn-helix domain-containing protein n=1 Tax=Nocardia huaxiensis TaxID=2755382 RepID=A0A7D6VCT3_9NOCA|nr:helix-turn-helix transcriptional regulator [Nocardia huaxiensis]QLY29797.1 helix-turn-helix domain-containing protein [Nocardia huaxiensis]UFS96615.1 helix-turn-helix domain-containing protein [Nocardia huaxiensis]
MDFGNFMQHLRKRAPRSALSRAAAHLEVTRFVLMRMEEGSPTRMTTPQLVSLLDFYEVTPEERAEALRLWSEIREQDKVTKAQGNSKGFWKAYSDQVAPNFPKFLRLEGAADHIIAHQPVVIPGLLQTADYRRSVDRIDNPDLSAVDMQRRLVLAAHRQARLGESGFRFEAFLSEAVLRHRPGAPSMMRAQLQWIAEVSEYENVSVYGIPFSVGPHPGLTIQTFTLLQFPTGASGMTLPSVIYAEGAIGSTFHEDQAEVDHYLRAIEGLRAVALTEAGTRDMVLRIAKEYAT